MYIVMILVYGIRHGKTDKRTGSDPAHIIYYDYNNVEIATYA